MKYIFIAHFKFILVNNKTSYIYFGKGSDIYIEVNSLPSPPPQKNDEGEKTIFYLEYFFFISN